MPDPTQLRNPNNRTRPDGVKPLTQDGRTAILQTPLGKDVLALVSFDMSEGLSDLFEINVEAISEDKDINFDVAIGQECTVRIRTFTEGIIEDRPEDPRYRNAQPTEDRRKKPLQEQGRARRGEGEDRFYSGILVAAQCTGPSQVDYMGYRLTLRPWLYLLSKTTDCRIFEEKTAPQIIKEVFSDRGFTNFESKLTDESSYPKLEYCVQYRETDFNFVSRMMEKEGIYYYFKHEDDKHTLVLADSKSSHEPVPRHATIPFIAPSGNWVSPVQRIEEWTNTRRFRTGKVAFNDYNYEKPNTQMLGDASGSEKYSHADMEFYHYPGNYKEQSIGARYAKIELEAEQAEDYRRHGNGYAPNLFPGGLTKLQRHYNDSQNIEYLLVRATHTYGMQNYRSRGKGENEAYHGTYEFQPSDRPYRAPIVTPKPRIYGIQTAKVVTKDEGSSEEIDVEKLTEIYVWFYWDRKKHKEKRSCKIRVAQCWSGKKWGGQFIPRVGMEVVVEFVEGDPDRPLIVGTVYNDEYKPPYDLPSKKNIAGLYSDSTKGHGGYNEFSLDDTKMSEKIRMHAEKDHEVVIRHAETTEIGEIFEIPKGSPSRETTLKMGDDKLTISMGDQNVSIPLGSQKTDAMIQIMDNVLISSTTHTPASISAASPTINHNAMITINYSAGVVVNVSAPIINLTGIVNINGALNVTGPALIAGMVPVCIPA